MDIWRRFVETIEKYSMLRTGDRVVVGVSGGPDSLCLLHLLKAARKELQLEIYAAHVDHMFRGEESREDARFVRDTCKEWDIPFFEIREDVPGLIERTGLSPEDAARRVRHKFFQKLKSELDADVIATGHNRDDNEETILMNILRGTGPEGLLGIEPKRSSYIRPLIEVPRTAIEEYLDKHGLKARIDATNLTTDYFRNSLRLELIPLIKSKYCPHLGESLRRLSDIIQVEQEFLSQIEKRAWKRVVRIGHECIEIDKEDFLRLPTALKHRVLRRGVKNILGDAKDFEYRHVLLAMDFIDTAATGSRLDLPRGLAAEMGYGKFILSLKRPEEVLDFYHEVKVPGEIHIHELGIWVCAQVMPKTLPIMTTDPLIAQLDYDKIKANLVVRKRRPGDRFRPLGSKYTKKIKDFFIDEKVPRRRRDEIPIFESGGEIVWVGGLRIDDRFKVAENTERVLFLHIKKENDSD